MSAEAQVDAYIAAQPVAKREALAVLHRLVLGIAPDARLWFLDGRNADGKIVSNPNIGYGERMHHAGGKVREFYRVGLSANTAGISVYIMGLDDRTYLARTFGATIGKATVTGYCIKFRAIEDIDLAVLEAAIRSGFEPEALRGHLMRHG